MNVISFFEMDLVDLQNPHDDIIIISMTIAIHDVKRILVDSESLTDVFFYDAFTRMNLPLSQLRRVSILLVSFSGDSIKVEDEISLPVVTGTPP